MEWTQIIKTFLEDKPECSELATNGTNSIFTREKGKRIEYKNAFKNEEDYIYKTKELLKLIEPDKNPNTLKYIAEGRLWLNNKKNSARVHVMLPPAVDVPMVTIAKKSQSLATIQDIYSSGSMNSKMKDFIIALSQTPLNVVLSGSTGAGKTTFLEAMTKNWDNNLRVGVAEDSPELKLIQPNVVYYHASVWRPGSDMNDVATLDWCVQQINRARTDILIIGETRSKEFFNFLVAANSGQVGYTTLHANDSRMALKKMSQFCLQGLPQPTESANQSILDTVNIIIQLTKNIHGKYRVKEISEVTGSLNRETLEIPCQVLFEYDEQTDTWNDYSSYMSDKLKTAFTYSGFNYKTFVRDINFNGGSSSSQTSQNTEISGLRNRFNRI